MNTRALTLAAPVLASLAVVLGVGCGSEDTSSSVTGTATGTGATSGGGEGQGGATGSTSNAGGGTTGAMTTGGMTTGGMTTATTGGMTTTATGGMTTGGMTTTTGGGGECAPDPNDDACTACTKANCCDQAMACLADTNCACYVDCTQNGGDLAMCFQMCGAPGQVTQDFGMCVQGNGPCAGDCSMMP